MADEQVAATAKTDKHTNPIRDHLFALARHVDNLEFPEAMERLVMLQQARDVEFKPKYMMAIIKTAIADVAEKATRPLRDHVVTLLRKEEPIPPEKLLDILGGIGMAEERIQATCEFVATAADFIGEALGKWFKKCSEEEAQPEDAAASGAEGAACA